MQLRGNRLLEPRHARASKTDDFGMLQLDCLAGLRDDCCDRALGVFIYLEGAHAACPHGGTSVSQAGQLEPIFDGRHRPLQGRHHRIGAADHHRHLGRRLADLDDGLFDQLLETVATVLTKAGHHNRIEGAVVGHDPIHDSHRREVAFEVAIDRLCRNGVGGQ